MTRARQAVTSVLVVDDEPMVRLCAVEMLTEAGFAVFEADDAESALERLEQHPQISVLFTDINMPGAFDGLELARRVHALRPEVQLIITSGRGRPAQSDLSDGEFVLKPYEVAAISRMIHAATARRVIN
jgi:CheY-like chemotaxis protein